MMIGGSAFQNSMLINLFHLCCLPSDYSCVFARPTNEMIFRINSCILNYSSKGADAVVAL
jgi:hypothetical protein